MENNIDIAYLAKFLETQMNKSLTVAGKNWMYDLPETDEEAIDFLCFKRDPISCVSIKGLFKIYREHDGLNMLDSCEKILKILLGDEGQKR